MNLKYTTVLVLTVAMLTTAPAFGSLTRESRAALRQLIAQNPAAAKVSSRAIAVLVFPDVVKAGFSAGRYRTLAASYGLQAGVQNYGYALFFMNQKAVDWVNAAHGWSIGSGPSLVAVDKGMARTINTETLHSGIYAFTFDQQGLMGGLAIQGSKITRID